MVDVDLRDLPAPQAWELSMPIREVPRREFHSPAFTPPEPGPHGDPVVLHDQFADRWLLTEFASSGNNLCVYVSQTADPVTGGWFIYQFSFPDFPDYHKWGVWRDAYAMAANEGSPSAYAFDRASMLTGVAATFQRFTAPDLSGFSFQTLTPADTDGPDLPPVGSPRCTVLPTGTSVTSSPRGCRARPSPTPTNSSPALRTTT